MFSFVRNRPPLVVFFLCIASVTVAVFCFAFYIKNTDEVPDSDIKYDWVQLLKHFNTLEVCIASEQHLDEKIEENVIYETTEVQTSITINSSDIIDKFNSVRGFLTLEDWHTNCPKNNPKPSQLEINFDIPKPANVSLSNYDVCVTIKGPEEYLPKFSEPNCKPHNEGGAKKGTLTTSTRANLNEAFCKGGTLTKFYFHPQKKHNLASFLSDNEKSIIYVHLLWTSYVMLFLLLLIVVYGSLQSDYVHDSFLHKWMPFHNQ
ncbi:hypothetical protein NQ318_015077 [Aromia moschata]|uniref:TMEM248/TMEM219 domain-containing protein n=1 Tax=Aromia moschata TaxID=1265417 RepID=A0AAV8YYB4_9CUCU|nr:hypothetical protein NQ318_015077 [Aromia moschata]